MPSQGIEHDQRRTSGTRVAFIILFVGMMNSSRNFLRGSCSAASLKLPALL